MGNMSLDYVGLHVWSMETINGHGESQVGTYRANGLGSVNDGYEACTEGLRWLKD